jgi:hypothetical protein
MKVDGFHSFFYLNKLSYWKQCGGNLAECGWDLADWLQQRLTANAEVATVLGSIPASSDTVADEAVTNKVHEKNTKIPLYS